MVADNAAQGLQQRAVKWLSDTNNLQQAMNEVSEALSLPRLPNRMECYDISNIQGSNPVGSMVFSKKAGPRTVTIAVSASSPWKAWTITR